MRHLYSTRRGGVSQGNLGPMNLGFSRGDQPESVMENYRRISYVSDICSSDMVFSDQVHGDRIVSVDQRGPRRRDLTEVDGLVTDKPQVCLVTFYADCVPLFFSGSRQKSHWTGTCGMAGDGAGNRPQNGTAYEPRVWQPAGRYSGGHWSIHWSLLL